MQNLATPINNTIFYTYNLLGKYILSTITKKNVIPGEERVH